MASRFSNPRGNFDSRISGYLWSPYGTEEFVDRGNSFFGSEQMSFTSVKTPGFRTMKKSQLPINPHSAYRELVTIGNCIYHEINPWSPKYTMRYVNYAPRPGSIPGCCPFLEVDALSGLDNRLRLKIKSKKVDLAVMGGEMRQTAAFLDKRVGGIFRLLNKRLIGRKIADLARTTFKTEVLNGVDRKVYFRKNPRIRSSRANSFKVTNVPYKQDANGKWIKNPYYTEFQHQKMSKLLSDTWLEYSYAFRPLLNDIYGAVEAVARVPYTVPSQVAKVTASVTEPINLQFTSASVLGNWQVKGSMTVKKEIGVRYFAENPLHALASLGLTNPLSLVWELVTLSFVVDWFYPIGTTLDSLDATLGCSFGGGYSSVRHKSDSDATLKFSNSDYLADFKLKISRELFYRQKLDSFPGVEMPRAKWPTALSQAASGLALFSQLFSKR